MTDEPSGENTTNRAVEEAAIEFVIAFEEAHGRKATDTRGRGEPADVVSDDGRVIEVKASGGSARGSDLWLETRQMDEARSNPNFHVYVVDNVRQGDPAAFRLIDLHSDVLAGLLQRARPQIYVTVPFPVAVYDAANARAIARQQDEDEKPRLARRPYSRLRPQDHPSPHGDVARGLGILLEVIREPLFPWRLVWVE